MKGNRIGMQVFMVFSLVIPIFAQSIVVEKITTTKDIKYLSMDALGTGPWTIYVDECEQFLLIPERVTDRAVKIGFRNSVISSTESMYKPTDVTTIRAIGEYRIGSSAGYEPPRDCRRLFSLRGYSHGKVNKEVLARGPRTVGSTGSGTGRATRVPMGGDQVGSREDRLHG